MHIQEKIHKLLYRTNNNRDYHNGSNNNNRDYYNGSNDNRDNYKISNNNNSNNNANNNNSFDYLSYLKLRFADNDYNFGSIFLIRFQTGQMRLTLKLFFM